MKKIWTKNYPNGVVEDVDMTQYSSFVDLFEESFKKYSDGIAFENMGKSVTYKELDDLSKNFANFLSHELTKLCLCIDTCSHCSTTLGKLR